MKKDENSQGVEKWNTSELSLLQTRKSTNAGSALPYESSRCLIWYEWSNKFTELEVKHEEMKAYYRALIEDLKESIQILLNDYIRSKPVTLNYNRHHEKVAKLRREKHELKKALLVQKINFSSLSEYVNDSMNKMKVFTSELKCSDTGRLIAEKMQLEKTVKDLTQEVETLSITNTKLLEDLRTQAFFDKYHQTLQQLTKLQADHEKLINFKAKEVEKYELKTREYTSLSVWTNRLNEFMGNIPLSARTNGSKSDRRYSVIQSQLNSSWKVPFIKIPKKDSIKSSVVKPRIVSHVKQISLSSKISSGETGEKSDGKPEKKEPVIIDGKLSASTIFKLFSIVISPDRDVKRLTERKWSVPLNFAKLKSEHVSIRNTNDINVIK